MWSWCNSVAPSAFPVLHIPFYPGKKDSRPLFSGSRWTPGDKGGGSGGSFIPPLPIRAFLPDNCAVKAALCKFPLETRECRFASVFSLEKSRPCPAFSERDVGKTVWSSLNPGKCGMGAPEILGMEETRSQGRPWICSPEPETGNSLESWGFRNPRKSLCAPQHSLAQCIPGIVHPLGARFLKLLGSLGNGVPFPKNPSEPDFPAGFPLGGSFALTALEHEGW